MNTHFKRWIRQAVDELDGIFTVHQVLEKVVEMKGTSMYIGSVNSISHELNRIPNVERIDEAKYRKVIV
jgi:hypothetical protein|tara:strand:- start:3251 stop:3457 length:207 start_codon:yes stop_codon:yes gene_type:complete